MREHQLASCGTRKHLLGELPVNGSLRPRLLAGLGYITSDTVQNTMRVHYVGNDSHLHELYISGGSWHAYDLTVNTGGPQVQPLTPIANVLH